MGGEGLPSREVLCPLLQCLIVDELLGKLSKRSFVVQSYADNVALLVQELFLEQNALGIVKRWCRGTGLLINPLKTGLVAFTRKYKVGTIEESIFEKIRLITFESVKYSGADIVCRQEKVAKNLPLDGYATVFQTEILAILRCAQLALERREAGRCIRICSDNQATIRALNAPICTPRLVWDYRVGETSKRQRNYSDLSSRSLGNRG